MTGYLAGRAEGPRDDQSVTVLFFAGAREAAGTSSASFGSADWTVGKLTGELVEIYGPDLGRVLSTCAIWVNGAPAPPSRVLCAGDEVAVLPPISGGAC